MTDAQEFHQRLESVAALARKIEAAADPSLRANLRELIESLMMLQGQGLERALELISSFNGTPQTGQQMIDRLGADAIVSSLLLLYGIHPVDLEIRVRQGVDKARASLARQGAELELVSIDASGVRLRVTAHGCGSSATSFQESITELIYQSAPDVASIFLEGDGAREPDFVPLSTLGEPVTAAGVSKAGL